MSEPIHEESFDIRRNALTTDGNLHSKNLARALLWLVEMRLAAGDLPSEQEAAGAEIVARLRDDVRLAEWQSRPWDPGGTR